MRTNKFESLRNQRGALMGTADLLIVVPFAMLSIIMIVDSCVIGFYKQKLAFVSTQAATYAANLPPRVEPGEPTRAVANELIRRCDLKGSNISVSVRAMDIASKEAIRVSIAGDFALLQVQGVPLPLSINMSDSSTCLVPPNRVCAAIAISPFPYSCQNPDAKISVYVPIIQPTNEVPVWEFPNQSAINTLHLTQGPVPVPAALTKAHIPRPSLY